MNLFSTMTEADVAERNAKVLADKIRYSQGDSQREEKPLLKASACSDESVLHDRIAQHCRENDWNYFSGSMAHRSKRKLGEPDYHIYARGGRYFAIECKAKGGKLSPDQSAVIAQAKRNGIVVHVIRSYEEFIEIVKQPEHFDDIIP